MEWLETQAFDYFTHGLLSFWGDLSVLTSLCNAGCFHAGIWLLFKTAHRVNIFYCRIFYLFSNTATASTSYKLRQGVLKGEWRLAFS